MTGVINIEMQMQHVLESYSQDPLRMGQVDEVGQALNANIIQEQLQTLLGNVLPGFIASHADLSSKELTRLQIFIIKRALTRVIANLHNYTLFTAGSPKRDLLLKQLEVAVDNTLHEANSYAISSKEARVGLSIIKPRNETSEESYGVSSFQLLEGSSDIVRDAAGTGYTIADTLMLTQKILEKNTLEHSLHIGLFARAANFILTPFMYLACKIEGKPIPKLKEKNVNWALSGIGLALFLAIVFIPPVGIAGFVALTGAGLAVSAYSLIDHYHKRGKLKREVVVLQKQKKSLIAELIHTKDELHNLEEVLSEKLEKSKILPPSQQAKNSQVMGRLAEKIKTVKARHERLKTALQEVKTKLSKKQVKYKEMYKKSESITLKSVGFIAAGIAVAGAVTLFFIPPVGMALLAAASIIGIGMATYKVGSWAAKKIGAWRSNRNKQVKKSPAKEEEASQQLESPMARFSAVPQHDLSHAETSEVVHGSTSYLMQHLYQADAGQKVSALIMDSSHAERIIEHLDYLISVENYYGIIKFFAAIGKANDQYVLNYYFDKNNIVNINEAKKMLSVALDKVLDSSYTLVMADSTLKELCSRKLFTYFDADIQEKLQRLRTEQLVVQSEGEGVLGTDNEAEESSGPSN
ncbi:MAG: hypothetical protein A3E87_01515 [Gammaproteobacteria bacterium RIFCSPHIGHO2_12_FULL_35_23]|nr:MAG: hypothetical protein A3E87_01515 [Gammaproteobacteria bacterium RIFCSPHIGHO2_12_FULL_35_23]